MVHSSFVNPIEKLLDLAWCIPTMGVLGSRLWIYLVSVYFFVLEEYCIMYAKKKMCAKKADYRISNISASMLLICY
jgi:hypothetical protein